MQRFLESIDLQSEKIGERLKTLRKELKMTVEEFYSPVMKSYNNGSAIENGKRKLGKRLAKDIIEYYNISLEYIQTGKGEKLLKVKPYNKQTFNPRTVQQHSEENVPYYDVNLADLQQSLPDVFRDSTPEYYVDFRPFNDCTAYLPMYGDSMYPRYASGEILAIKEITNMDVIQWGEAYLVVTNERANAMVTVKLLYEHANPGKLILRASNPNYKGDTVIARSSIVKLYIIKGKITRNQL